MRQTFQRTIRLYREAFSGHPRGIWILAGVTFINRLGTMVLPFLTVYLNTELNFSLKEAGLLASGFGMGSLVGSYLGGRLADRIGARTVMFWSLLMGGVALFLLQYAHEFGSIFALIFLSAALGDGYRPAMMSILGELVPKKETGRAMALIRLTLNLGFSAAPALGGVIIASIGYEWLFWIDGITCVLAALFFRLAMPNAVVEESDRQRSEGKVPPVEVSPQRNGNYLIFLASSLVVGFAFIQWFQSVPVFLKTEWGFDERYIGMLMAINGLLIAGIEMPLIHGVEKGRRKRLAQFIGIALIGNSFLPFLLPKAWILGVIAMLLLTVGEIAFLPLNSSQALNMSPAGRRGEYMAWYSMSWGLVHILGPSVGLSLVDWLGYDVFWGILIVMIALSAVVRMRRGFTDPPEEDE